MNDHAQLRHDGVMISKHASQNVILYGIPNCDTVVKARDWLSNNHVFCEFHDFKKLGLPLDQVNTWIKSVGYEKLLNRRGTSWHKLNDDVQASVVDAVSAVAVMKLNTSVIKRPVVQWGNGQITVGFDERIWAKLIS